VTLQSEPADPTAPTLHAARVRQTAIERAPLPDGASVVETVPYRLTQRVLAEIEDRRGCAEITGLGGTGKTFAVDDFFTRHAEIEVTKIHLEDRVKGHGFLRRLIAELMVERDPRLDDADASDLVDPALNGRQLMRRLRSVVGARHVYVYVDEADLLNRDSLRQIRYLRDQRDIHIAWVLVGTNFAEAYRLVPELWSRVNRRVCFDPLPSDALTTTLAAYHPFFAAADPHLLAAIDAEHCRGNWRVWSEVFLDLVDYAARMHAAGLTAEVAAAVLGVTVDRHRSRPPRGSAARRPRGKAA
jgi:DNA transposition AAA+ family ATPase